MNAAVPNRLLVCRVVSGKSRLKRKKMKRRTWISNRASYIPVLLLAATMLSWVAPSQATFYNPFGIVIVKKTSDPADDTAFDFSTSLGSSFQLSDPSDKYTGFFAWAGGDPIRITEEATPGWRLESVTTWSLLGNSHFTPIANGIQISLNSWDVVKVKFNNVAVPIPGAVWLLGSGLLALVGIGRSRRRKIAEAGDVPA